MQGNYTVEEAAKLLRGYAEMTARMSQNWENYEEILRQALTGAVDFGVARGKELALPEAGEAQAVGGATDALSDAEHQEIAPDFPSGGE